MREILLAWWKLGVTYVALRLLFVVGLEPVLVADSYGYVAVSFTGDAYRLWTYPVVRWFGPDEVTVIAQTVASALAFLLLANEVGRTIYHQAVRVGAMAAVLLLGVSTRVTAWDGAILTESLAVTLTILLIVAVMRYRTVPTAALVAVFVAWLFLRDAHAVLGVAVAIPLAVVLWSHQRKIVAGAVVAAAAWGFLAASNDRTIEANNLAANVAHRVAIDPESMQWMRERGMPDSKAFDAGHPITVQTELRDDAEWMEWARSDGTVTYGRFIATHPAFAWEGVRTLLGDDRYAIDESMTDETFAIYTHQRADWLSVVWPDEATLYTALLMTFGLGGGLLLLSRRDRRVVAPGILYLSTFPHGFVVYHGAPIEIARHAVVLAFVLVLSCVWLIALGVDVLFASRPHPGVGESDQVGLGVRVVQVHE